MHFGFSTIRMVYNGDQKRDKEWTAGFDCNETNLNINLEPGFASKMHLATRQALCGLRRYQI